MATRKGSIAMNADFSQLDSAIGALNGMAATVRTDRFLAPLVVATHNRLGETFDLWMDMTAEGAPEMFHHVYEWGIYGQAGRLWTHELKGRGSSNRLASWAWRASKIPIPTPQERAQNPNDPMSSVDPAEVAQLSERKNIFIWKAPVMEYNQSVNIRPNYAKMIAFPSDDNPGELMFVKQTTVSNPGGEATTMAFTKAWTSWWNTVAPTILDDTIGREIQAGIERGTDAAVKKGSRKASVGIKTMSYAAAASQGYKWASANLNAFAQRYQFQNAGSEDA